MIAVNTNNKQSSQPSSTTNDNFTLGTYGFTEPVGLDGSPPTSGMAGIATHAVGSATAPARVAVSRILHRHRAVLDDELRRVRVPRRAG